MDESLKETFMIGLLGGTRQFNYPIPFKKYPICHTFRDEMDEWCKENCEGDYYAGLFRFWFVDVHDAMAFKLRWM